MSINKSVKVFLNKNHSFAYERMGYHTQRLLELTMSFHKSKI